MTQSNKQECDRQIRHNYDHPNFRKFPCLTTYHLKGCLSRQGFVLNGQKKHKLETRFWALLAKLSRQRSTQMCWSSGADLGLCPKSNACSQPQNHPPCSYPNFSKPVWHLFGFSYSGGKGLGRARCRFKQISTRQKTRSRIYMRQ